MFRFLKDKLGKALARMSKKVEEVEDVKLNEEKEVHGHVEEKKVEVKQEKEKEPKKASGEERHAEKSLFSKIFKRKPSEIQSQETKPEKKLIDNEAEKKGIFSLLKERITTTRISAGKFSELFSELEVTLLENNVAVEVVEKIKGDLERKLVDQPLKRGEVLKIMKGTLHTSIEEILGVNQKDVVKMIKEKTEKPFVIAFVGVNGSGKTTTIAKFAYLLKKQGLSCILVAADTWRSAAIQQLEEHGKKLNVRVVKHDYGSDPAAVAFDGIKAAKASKVDVVLIDTAGRQQSNVNLMREMEKIMRVANPDLKIFIGESITGNDCVVQAKEFDKNVAFDGIILTKADVDERGGAAISIGYVTQKPILYLGVGQKYEDLKWFEPKVIIESLGL